MSALNLCDLKNDQKNQDLDNIASAYKVLATYPGTEKVADVYDTDDEFSSALTTLIPNFEYPNFSFLTIKEVKSKVICLYPYLDTSAKVSTIKMRS